MLDFSGRPRYDWTMINTMITLEDLIALCVRVARITNNLDTACRVLQDGCNNNGYSYAESLDDLLIKATRNQ